MRNRPCTVVQVPNGARALPQRETQAALGEPLHPCTLTPLHCMRLLRHTLPSEATNLSFPANDPPKQAQMRTLLPHLPKAKATCKTVTICVTIGTGDFKCPNNCSATYCNSTALRAPLYSTSKCLTGQKMYAIQFDSEKVSEHKTNARGKQRFLCRCTPPMHTSLIAPCKVDLAPKHRDQLLMSNCVNTLVKARVWCTQSDTNEGVCGSECENRCSYLHTQSQGTDGPRGQLGKKLQDGVQTGGRGLAQL